jgi:hypothetical protein
MTEEEKEEFREKGKWVNFKREEDPKPVPTTPTDKRPPDEFFDLTSIQTIREHVLAEDGGIVKYVVEEGKGEFIDGCDEVFYRHETRFDNGQLVDFSEKRKAIDKFIMNNPNYHDFYKVVMRTMKKGETAWCKFSKRYTGGVYHKTPHFITKSEEEKAKIGESVYIRMYIDKIKRNPIN